MILAWDQSAQWTAFWSRIWQHFGVRDFGEWLLVKGTRIALIIIATILVTRFVKASANVIARGSFKEQEPQIRGEAARQRATLLSAFIWVFTVIQIFVAVLMIATALELPISGFAPLAAVAGAGLGFGAQRIVQDVLSGFFIIAEKQYRIGDLVQLAVLGTTNDPIGTVEQVTLRVTKLRSTDGELYTVPNGQIIKSTNLSKDWAQAVVDIPVPASSDIAVLREKLTEVCDTAKDDPNLKPLLRSAPTFLGVEGIEMDQINMRIVANSVPGQQFVLSRRLRAKALAALRQEGINTVKNGEDHAPERPQQRHRPTRPEEDTAPQERVRD
ncbi:hypothetical protein HMPREF9336_01771 [Segniliparus rugosus ATCC BAA-974]|uniref:Mechanosensitive ion channel protein MscS n=2 Tax=Segniliparus rugosus TaxID=286804 RepID=E5XQI4_SEGRC|nr:hypothetical protein HMPREF9336_01771 [Segniliparus rugosus ATCC BAA-974]